MVQNKLSYTDKPLSCEVNGFNNIYLLEFTSDFFKKIFLLIERTLHVGTNEEEERDNYYKYHMMYTN